MPWLNPSHPTSADDSLHIKEIIKKASADLDLKGVTDVRRRMATLCTRIIGERHVGQQEAIFVLLGYPLVNSNMPSVSKPRLQRVLKSIKDLPVDDQSEDCFRPDMMARYKSRPNSLESLSLYEYAEQYCVATKFFYRSMRQQQSNSDMAGAEQDGADEGEGMSRACPLCSDRDWD